MMNDLKFKCQKCPVAFDSHGKRCSHTEHVHRATINVKCKDDTISYITRTSDGLFNCPCGRTYNHGTSLRRHVKLCDALMMKGITQFKTNLVNSFSFLSCRYFANPVDLIIISIFIFVRIDPRQLHGKAD